MSITGRKHHAAAVVVTNFTASGGATVTLEGSMDGTIWFTLPDGGSIRVTGDGTSYRQSALPQPVLFLRANLKEIDVTVTAITVNAPSERAKAATSSCSQACRIRISSRCRAIPC